MTRFWLALLMGVLLIPTGILACGPWFPNTLLDKGDAAVLGAPRANFQRELERMKLLVPARAGSTNRPVESREADVADLRAALERLHTPNDSLENILNNYTRERLKITVTPDEPLRPTNAIRFSGPLPQLVPGLPGEFADYFVGAVAWHQNKIPDARSAWARLLERPSAERQFKSTWAAFMLGRSWEQENNKRAISYLKEVRDLSDSGFRDSLNLSIASLGYEARVHLREKRFRDAIDLYLQQAASGDPSALLSLRFAACRALEQGSAALRPLARHTNAQRVVTAYVIDAGWTLGPIDIDNPATEAALNLMSTASSKVSIIPAPKPGWHRTELPVRLWLKAVEATDVKDVESAEKLALAAYQGGDMAAAQRWLNRSPSTPAAQWLQAKLLLREGKVEPAAALLAKVCRLFRTDPDSTNQPANATLSDNLHFDDAFEQPAIPTARQVRGELGVYCLSRRQYSEALQALLESGYWMDAAFVAERVLTLDELKMVVDQNWPPSARPQETAPGSSPAPWSTRDKIRYLLARRLTRSDRWREALPYYPSQLTNFFQQLSASLSDARNGSLPPEQRALAYFKAAKINRKLGLELIGTELEPDWRIHDGNFEEGLTVRDRVNLMVTNHLGSTPDEIQRGKRHGVDPERRWHYRYVAGALAGKGARLMRDAEMKGLSNEQRAKVLFEAAADIHFLDGYAMETKFEPIKNEPALLEPYPSAILGWKAAQLLPNNSDETACVLCTAGTWIKGLDPQAADLFYKALVRRCRKTAIGAEADRLRWFPKLDEKVNLVPATNPPSS